MVAASGDRVERNTADGLNEAIAARVRRSLPYFRDNPGEIPARLRELDAEWDVERMLELMSSSLSLAGLVLTVFRGRRWVALPLAVQGFFLQHAVQGWCPPLPVLRRLGFRTQREIEQERHALSQIRAGHDADRVKK